MMVFGVLTLILSWTSLGADLATAVVSRFSPFPSKERIDKGQIDRHLLTYIVLSAIHSHLKNV